MHEIKVELGGGRTPRGDGFLNLDRQVLSGVDVVLDLESDPLVLPWGNGEVSALYSAHCLEHLSPAAFNRTLKEIVRVCQQGAEVEFRLPHWLSPFAMVTGPGGDAHRHVLCERGWRRICGEYAELWWAGCSRRLELLATRYVPETTYDELRPLFPTLSDDQVLRYIPDCCHEVRYYFTVVRHEP
jgi:hypothetical protein